MLGGFFKKKKALEESTALSPAIRDAVLQTVGAKSIPPMPSSAQKAFKLSVDPNAEARDFIDVIESDEALSARVMRIANSVFFDRGNKSTTIEDAVNVIGINELRCLLNSNTLSEIFPSKHPARKQLWSNDIATALIARNLAQSIIPAKAEVAFLGGLMHDLGKLLLVQRRPEEYSAILIDAESNKGSFCEAEEVLYPFNHSQVGQTIAEKWSFSPELAEIIAEHHHPWDVLQSKSSISLTIIVKAADIIAHSLGLGHTKPSNKVRVRSQEELSDVWQALRIPSSDQASLLTRCKRTYETEFDLYAGNQ